MLCGVDCDLTPYICYDINIITNTLTPGFYTAFQAELLEQIVKLRDKNLSFIKIAEVLNEQGQISTRGKTLKANHVFSILKKWKIRDLRLKAEPTITIDNFSIRYIVV